MNQLAGEVIYRLGKAENLFVGARYNTVNARLANTTAVIFNDDVKIDRVAFAGGWFLTKNILLKGEYVRQQYRDFDKAINAVTKVPNADFRSGGKFNGYVIEAIVGF